MTEGENIPRIVFSTEDEVRSWCTIIGQKKSIGYVTDKAEIVLVPDKSTRPLMFGYFKANDKVQAKKILEDCNVPTFSVGIFDWSEDRAMSTDDSIKARIAELAKKSELK